jgi:hypothetical protein
MVSHNASELFQLNVTHYFPLVSYVILYYDYLLTLPLEIQRFWTLRTFSWATFFFFFNRYLAILGHIPVILLTFWNSADLAYKSNICHLLQSFHQYLEVIIQLVVGILLIMRVYALYDRSRWVVVLFITFAAVDIGIGCWAIISKSSIHLPPQDLEISAPGCALPISHEQGTRLALAWGGQLAYDAVVFFLTLYKSILIVRTSHRPLISTLLRDGKSALIPHFVCFLRCHPISRCPVFCVSNIVAGANHCLQCCARILTVANLANILTFLLAAPISKGVTSTFSNIISATMISRLMLNLRDPKILMSTTNRTTGSTTITMTNPMISTVVDPNPSTVRYVDEELRYSQGALTNLIELMPPKRTLDSEA